MTENWYYNEKLQRIEVNHNSEGDLHKYEEIYKKIIEEGKIVFEPKEFALLRLKEHSNGTFLCRNIYKNKLFTANYNTAIYLLEHNLITDVAVIRDEFDFAVTDISMADDDSGKYFLTERGDGSFVIMHEEDLPPDVEKGDILTKEKLNSNKYFMVSGWDIFRKMDEVGQDVAEKESGVPMLTSHCEISFKKQCCNIDEFPVIFSIEDTFIVNGKKAVMLKLENNFVNATFLFREFRTNWCKRNV